MASTSKTTTDHDEIRRWVEKRGGFPATVKSTKDRSGTGVLRVDFPGYSGEDSLERISWDDFFEKFDQKSLAFLYQDKTADGKTSPFFKFVAGDEDTEEGGSTEDEGEDAELSADDEDSED